MKSIQETFLETDWDDEESARQARDDRADQLQAEGLICTRENLYNVSGYRVFLVEAKEPEPIDTGSRHRSLRPRRVNHTIPSYEER